MGSTRVDFRGQAFEASDSTLEVWLALLVREIDAMGTIPDWLHQVRDEWALQSTAGFGFGVMPQLDRFITDDVRRDAIVAVCKKVLAKLQAYGSVVPRSALNALKTGGEGSTFTKDVPTDVLVQPAIYFIDILQGTLTQQQTDARCERPAAE